MKTLMCRCKKACNVVNPLAKFDGPSDLSTFTYKRGMIFSMLIVAATFVITQVFMLLPYLLMMESKKHGWLMHTWVSTDMLHHPLITSSIVQGASYIVGMSAAVAFLWSILHKSGFGLRKLNKTAIHSTSDFVHNLVRALAYLAIGDILVAGLYKALSYLPSPNSPAGDFGQTLHSLPAFAGFAFMTVVLAPLFEELVFRGYFFNMFKCSLNSSKVLKFLRLGKLATPMAIVLCGAVFAGFHGTLSGFPPLFILGCVLAFTYNQTKHLTCSRMIHFLNNLLATFALYMAVSH